MIGLGVAYAAMQPWRRGRWAVLAGWVLAVLLHTLWDDSVRAGAARTAVAYVLLLAAFGVLMAAMIRDRRRIVGLMKECLTRFADPAVMTTDDLQMLADLRNRRIARQWARLHCGLRGGETMAGYQLTATELALAYDRARHGQMEQAAFEARRDSSLEAMRQAAAALRGLAAEAAAAILGPEWHVRDRAAAGTPADRTAQAQAGLCSTAAPPRKTTTDGWTDPGGPGWG